MPYDTKLSPAEENKFKTWKSIYAPKDSGQDYDLRGAFKAGLSPNPESGHWPDTFKKPNHPTFSNQSIYAKDAPEKAGTWQGDTYIPPTKSMAYNDDLLSAAQRRTRTGRSFFPAANYRQGQQIYGSGAGNAGFTPSNALLPPDQNPAYQAAIARPRAGSDAYAWITTPSGGQMRVPTASIGNLTRRGSDLAGSQITQIGNQAPVNLAASYAKGYGAPTPEVQQLPGGPALVQGGVANPVSNLTPAQRIQYGQGSALDYFRAGPTSLALQNLAGGFGQNIARWFGGGNAPNSFGGTSAAGAPPSPTPIPSATPTPTATPYQPTPTPIPPRRYSDYGYY